METNKLVVIGGDAAGMSAASKVRREHPKRPIVVFERGLHTSYAACGMPYYIAGEITPVERLIARRPEVFRDKQNIDVRMQHEVLAIDPARREVTVRDINADKEYTESWDDLLIATGAAPIRPDWPGEEAKGIFSLSSLQSGMDVFADIEAHQPQRAVVVGGGYIGIEMAEALLARGMQVALVDRAAQPMTTMDAEMAGLVTAALRESGVEVYLDEGIAGFLLAPDGRVRAVQTTQRELPADLVILGIGIRPNAELARAAGIALGPSGGIQIDAYQRTSMPGIWAAGDCAESWHRVKRAPVFIALGTVANKQGLVAGINLAGGEQAFPGVLGTAITRFKALEIARTGLSEREAQELGLDYRVSNVAAHTRSHYYPGGGKIQVKLLAEAGSGRLLGGQIVGAQGAGKRIDTIAAALTAELTAEQLIYMDLAYAPPFSPVWDPVQVAARQLL